MHEDLGQGVAPGRFRLAATLLPLDSRRGGRTGRSSFQRRFWSRDVEAPIALASPLSFPGCGGFVSPAAPAKLPEHGGSDSSIVAGFFLRFGLF